jgi:hypothetical protein
VHQRLMPGHEKPTAGASEVARRKIVAHPLAPPASPSLDRIKICCEDKMVPLRVGAWPKGDSGRLGDCNDWQCRERWSTIFASAR